MNCRKPITGGADISVLVVIVGLYLGLFLAKRVEQYQNGAIYRCRVSINGVPLPIEPTAACPNRLTNL
jgi:hypothetical protein